MTRRSRLLAIAVSIGAVGAGALSALASTGPQDLDQIIRSEFNVQDFDLIQVETPDVLGQPFFTFVEIEGQSYTMDLTPHSVRSDRYQVLVQQADGSIVEAAAPAISTYRGSLIEAPGSQVSASIVNGSLRAVVSLDEAHTFDIVSLQEAIEGGPRDFYVVTDVSEFEPGDWICGNDLLEGGGLDGPGHEGHGHEVGDGGDPEVDEVVVAEIAYDADYEFYNRNQQSLDNTIADIESVTNAMNTIYERDCEIRYEITTIIVRQNENDPYTTTIPDSLLNQFQSEWNRNQSGTPRDVAHLMTGKNLSGGVIGIAYLGVICNRNSAYGLSESRFSSSFSYRVALTAHETGHNWNAGHCSSNCNTGSDCRIMCPCLGGCSRDVSRFGESAKRQITSFRDSRNCLHPAENFRVEIGTLFGGQNGTFTVIDGAPNAPVRLYYSLRGEGSCPVPDLNVTLDLDRCVLGVDGMTDANGGQQWSTRIPNVNQIRLLWVQGAQDGDKTDVVLTQINP